MKTVFKDEAKSFPTPMGVGCVKFSGGKHYEGVRFNVISVTREWVGVQFSGKKCYVTLEWPLTCKSILMLHWTENAPSTCLHNSDIWGAMQLLHDATKWRAIIADNEGVG